jgi:hypothetical protein
VQHIGEVAQYEFAAFCFIEVTSSNAWINSCHTARKRQYGTLQNLYLLQGIPTLQAEQGLELKQPPSGREYLEAQCARDMQQIFEIDAP